MITKILQKMFGTQNERTLKRLATNVAAINEFEPQMQALSDIELRAVTPKLRQQLQDGATLAMILSEAFAAVREASVRTLGLRHFDVQLIGGMVLHEGKIAEMRTGEGKTLAATLAAYLNALTGKAVHIVTVNDYLAKRDAAWMGPIYDFLGLSVGVVVANQEHEEKKQAYNKDIVYGTNNEFGFDYLRDNMALSLADKVQRGLYFAIIDEVDSILIDEARTPLIISGPSDDSVDLYLKVNKLIPILKKQEATDGAGDYTLDEKTRQAHLTETGYQNVEKLLINAGLIQIGESLYDVKNVKIMHYLNAALRANTLFHCDVDYIVKAGEVVIVDEHTGRTMEGRRWSDGLHQAIEAKEGVPIRKENQTLASITFQNYFRIYDKIAGMTGTADTEAFEFQHIYGLTVVVIPTHMQMIRQDLPDQIYLTAKEKFHAILLDIKKRSEQGQPLLVGTASIETSEKLSALLSKNKIPHQVLNAKQHEREAKIIAQAGRPSAVTIATNMAGRGTDIVLGGNLVVELAELQDPTEEEIVKVKAAWQQRHDSVVVAGGLHVIGSERHESRRIDNQLRGRSGRQGDPGSSRFYLSLEDNLMRIFASDRMAAIMKKLGMQENEVIEHSLITRAVENAQRKVEGHNFDIRKNLLEFDDVANEQRKVVYKQRNELMQVTEIAETIELVRADAINMLLDTFIPPQSLEEQWDIENLERQLQQDFTVVLPLKKWLELDSSLHEETLRYKIIDEINKVYQQKAAQVNPETLRHIERSIMLQTLDLHWKNHLAAMDHLREGIHLRGYAQQNPKQEYKRESFFMFKQMLEDIKRDVTRTLYAIQIKTEEEIAAIEEERRRAAEAEQNKMSFIHAATNAMSEDTKIPEDAEANTPYVREQPKVGRNDSCPCGSGKKYKHCHGKLS